MKGQHSLRLLLPLLRYSKQASASLRRSMHLPVRFALLMKLQAQLKPRPRKKPVRGGLTFFLVGMKGLEPSRLATLAPKASVSTNSTTSPRRNRRAGFHKQTNLFIAASSRFLLLIFKVLLHRTLKIIRRFRT